MTPPRDEVAILHSKKNNVISKSTNHIVEKQSLLTMSISQSTQNTPKVSMTSRR